jgi:hypothetical protein
MYECTRVHATYCAFDAPSSHSWAGRWDLLEFHACAHAFYWRPPTDNDAAQSSYVSCLSTVHHAAGYDYGYNHIRPLSWTLSLLPLGAMSRAGVSCVLPSSSVQHTGWTVAGASGRSNKSFQEKGFREVSKFR